MSSLMCSKLNSSFILLSYDAITQGAFFQLVRYQTSYYRLDLLHGMYLGDNFCQSNQDKWY